MRVGECYQGAGLVVQLVESESGGTGPRLRKDD
jgi:hypothetical protein